MSEPTPTPPTGPILLIAGSADSNRTDYDPPVDVQAAQAACEALGKELAHAGWRIMVFSSDPAFIEVPVVRGYVAANPAGRERIEVRFPMGSRAAAFPEYMTHPGLFAIKADPNPEWKASYYRALRDADAVLMIGGGQSVTITGYLALGYRIPLMSLATFGGAAFRLRTAITPGLDLPSNSDCNLMSVHQWVDDTASRCVKALNDQLARRKEEIAVQANRDATRQHVEIARSIWSGSLFLACIVLLAVGFNQSSPVGWLFSLLLFGSGAIAGASGSTVRMLRTSNDETPAIKTTVLGLVAGGVSAILYIIGQLAANPGIFKAEGAGAVAGQTQLLIVFAVAIGFIAGFTFDAVYRKLMEADVTNVDTLKSRTG